MMAKKYTSKPINIGRGPLASDFRRADIEFHEVDHSQASFEGRVFLNNPGADENTPKTVDDGYAGSFHIFGHGGCFGNVGHCDISEQRPFDPRPSHPLTPSKQVVIATKALRHAKTQGGEVTVTVVPVITGINELCSTDEVLKFDHISIVTYD